MEWIMSLGGPIICMEATQMKSWGGVARLSAPDENAATDYDRACEAKNFTAPLLLQNGMALVVNTGPQDTSIWTSTSGVSYIVVVECAEPDIDEASLLAGMSDRIFDSPLGLTEIEFSSSALVMFDSADPGDDQDVKFVQFALEAGRYQVLSQTFQPNSEISFIVHKLQLLSSGA